MSALSIQPTYPIFTDIDGQPLEDGFVWIGQANLDPQVNPINVFWDAALTIPAGQPIRTLGGYPSNSGTPARLYVNSDYSIRVMNKNGSVVYSAPAATERYNSGVISSINAVQVDYDPAGLGAVQTNVQAKLRETVSVKDFGAVGDGVTDDTAAINAALATGKVVFLPAGSYAVESPILVPRGGASLVGYGQGLGFAQAVIRPLASFSGSALFVFDGDNEVGGWSFRNRLADFMVWCDRVDNVKLPAVISVDKAYSLYFKNLWLEDVPGSGFLISESNNIHIDSCLLGGRNNSTSPYGVRCLSDSTGGTYITNCDIENFSVGVSQETDARVFLTNPYIERCGTGWKAIGNSSGQMTVLGGKISGINASTNCALIGGPNVSVFGGAYYPNGGGGILTNATTTRLENIQVVGVPVSVYTPYRNLYQQNNLSDVAKTWIEYTAIASKTVDDAVATSLFDITCPTASGNSGFCEVEVFCRMSGNNEVISSAKYTFSFSNTATIRANPVVEIEKSGWAATGNWSLTISGSTSASGTTIAFQITADTGGALGAGLQVLVTAKAKLVTPVTTGAIYIQPA